MKHINEESCRLKQANKRIEELESKLSKLLNENAALRAIKTPKESSRTTTPPTKSTIPNDTRHYAQSTVSSRCKDNSMPQKPQRNGDKAPRAVLINGERCVYKAGGLTHITTSWGPYPRFMEDTKASCNRNFEIFEETWARKRQLDFRNLKRQPKEEPRKSDTRCSTPIVEEVELLPEEPQQQTPSSPTLPEPTFSTAGTEVESWESSDTEVERVGTKVESALEPDLAEKTRLNDHLNLRKEIIYIKSKTGLDFLRRAAEITQNAIFDFRSFMPEWKTWMFEDGPHVVRLGRDEMIRWMGGCNEYCENLHNGRLGRDISRTLLSVVCLRNTISHPHGYELRDPERLDYRLVNAQNVSIVLGDEKRALEIRGIRDALRTEVDRSLQEIKDLCHLTPLPYCNVDYQSHHVETFQSVLYDGYHGGSKEVLAAAEAWERVAG
ncbi:hypothetical protein F4801DRAFT_603307 [Xylaria longipes]|nr:hypothetical protein F4801DRAFT_603307 [Xylaria longipes]